MPLRAPRPRTLGLLVAAIVLGAPVPASAAARQWVGGPTGSWHTAANWSGNQVPGPTDVAFTSGAPATITIAGATASAGTIGGSDGTKFVVDGTSLTLTALGDGATQPTSGSAVDVVNGGSVTLSGLAEYGGTMTLGDTGAAPDTGTLLVTGTNRIFGTIAEAAAGKGLVRVQPGGTLRATGGNLLQINTRLQNDGRVLLSSSAFGNSLFLQPAATSPASSGAFTIGDDPSLTNQPQLVMNLPSGVTLPLTAAAAVTGPGRLNVQAVTTTGAGTLDVPQGATFTPRELRVFGPAALELDADATVQTFSLTHSGGPAAGGRLGGGDLRVTGPAASTIAGGAGQARLAGAGTTTVEGPLGLGATAVSDGAVLRTTGATTWRNGIVALGTDGTPGRWDNLADLTISADGDGFTFSQLETRGGGVLRNLASGTITKLDAGETLRGAGAVENAGTIDVRAGRFGTASDGAGPRTLTQTGGLTTVAPGATLGKETALQGGVLQGSGSVQSIDNPGGMVRPGSSPGTLTVLDTFTQQPPAPQLPTSQPVDPVLECVDREVELLDVVAGSEEVRLRGVAARQHIGATVEIVFAHTDKVVDRVTVAQDGTFGARAALPPRDVRATDRARYQARIGSERSLNLKLTRRMRMTSVTKRDDQLRVAGRVTRPLARPIAMVEIRRRVTCDTWKVVARVKPGSDGWFKSFVNPPEDRSHAVYRATTRVRNNTGNPKTFPTFTLPRALELPAAGGG
jgi:hypothetical protein